MLGLLVACQRLRYSFRGEVHNPHMSFSSLPLIFRGNEKKCSHEFSSMEIRREEDGFLACLQVIPCSGSNVLCELTLVGMFSRSRNCRKQWVRYAMAGGNDVPMPILLILKCPSDRLITSDMLREITALKVCNWNVKVL